MSKTIESFLLSNAWPFVEAKKILERIDYKIPDKGYVLFETGYGPSGLPHIGTFGEVARTTFVREAFMRMSDIPTRLICFSDDMDGLRKVPLNVPNQKLIEQYIGRPLTSIPDPYEQEASFGHYMNKKLRYFLDRFGFQYEFYSATECYKSGTFDHMMIKVIDKYEEIMALMLPTFRTERRETYSPFMPISPTTGIVLQVPIENIDPTNKTITYRSPETNQLVETSVTGGSCKLQWKPDFGMRWVALGVDYEMYGKDHLPNGEIYSKICEILGGKRPIQLFYELFLSEEGDKISKSKGNGITVDDWLHYAPLESMSLYMYQSPSKAKRLHFDVIPKCVDEYLTFISKYHVEEDQIKKIFNPVFHIHNGKVPIIETFGLSFRLLLNLAGVCNPDDKSVLWGFITKYIKEANAISAPYLDHLVNFVVNYYNDFIKQSKFYPKMNDKTRGILQQILDMLQSIPVNIEAERIQEKIYDIGMAAGYDNLRDYFKDIYQNLLGQTEGPRLGSFIKLYGIEESKRLITNRINNDNH
ncbi:MAG: lysine--tRNA ligase [Rickettsiaceae bacterium]|nr:MAG: lysine--tRNA ligase [Rickettsiaceae bacterium]